MLNGIIRFWQRLRFRPLLRSRQRSRLLQRLETLRTLARELMHRRRRFCHGDLSAPAPFNFLASDGGHFTPVTSKVPGFDPLDDTPLPWMQPVNTEP